MYTEISTKATQKKRQVQCNTKIYRTTLKFNNLFTNNANNTCNQIESDYATTVD